MNDCLYAEYVEMITGKNVIVVGPALCVIDDCKNVDVDGYDCVCRVNCHWKELADDEGCMPIGARTDIIYHCMNHQQYTVSDLEIWNKKGIYVISAYDINDINDKRGRGRNFQDRNLDVGFNRCLEISKYYMDINRRFNLFLNTGTLAVLHLLSLPIKSVTVVGFDFYKTHYWKGSNEELRCYTREKNITHSVKRQFALFKDYVNNVDKFIPLGELNNMLKNNNEQ